jgi:small basic protein
MIVYLVGGICIGIMLRPYVDEVIKNYVNRK